MARQNKRIGKLQTKIMHLLHSGDYSVREVAKKYGIPKSTLHNFAKGKTKNPRFLKDEGRVIHITKSTKKELKKYSKRTRGKISRRIIITGLREDGSETVVSSPYVDNYNEIDLALKDAKEKFFNSASGDGVEITEIKFHNVRIPSRESEKINRVRQYVTSIRNRVPQNRLPVMTYDVETRKGGAFEISSIWGYDDYGNKVNKARFSDGESMLKWMAEHPAEYYAHNGGKFDIYYLLDEILIWSYAGLKVVFADDKMGMVKIYNEKKECILILRDSFRILPYGLENLSKELKSSGTLSEEDYEFCKANRDDIQKIIDKRPGLIQDYVDDDCLILLDVLEKFNNMLTAVVKELSIKANFRKNFTSSSIVMNMFKKHHGMQRFKDELMINEFYDAYVRESYYGGRTQAFRKKGVKLSCYDIVSLYPHVLAKYGFPKGQGIKTLRYRKGKMGIYKVRFLRPQPIDTTLPILPVRDENGVLQYNEVEDGFEGIYTSVDLEEMARKGYYFKVLKGVYFEKTYNPFSRFINTLFERKKQAKAKKQKALAFVVKILLNSFYGKFGQRRIFNSLTINDCRLDVFKSETKTKQTSVHIAAFVTAYARRELNRQAEKVLKAGFKVYYCDTDSLYVDAEAGHLFDVGKELGQWELENEVPILEAHFLQKKVYAYKYWKKIELEDGSIMWSIDTEVKCKGFGKNAFSFEQIKKASETGEYLDLEHTMMRFVTHSIARIQGKELKTWFPVTKRIIPPKEIIENHAVINQ